jgi:hypothetical protein
MTYCNRLCLFASLIMLQFNIKAQSNETYSLTRLFSNRKPNTLAKDKATIQQTGEFAFQFETECGKIDAQFKKRKKLKLQLLNSQSEPCSDILLGIFEDIRTNLMKTNKISALNTQLIFFAKKDTLFIFEKQKNN